MSELQLLIIQSISYTMYLYSTMWLQCKAKLSVWKGFGLSMKAFASYSHLCSGSSSYSVHALATFFPKFRTVLSSIAWNNQQLCKKVISVFRPQELLQPGEVGFVMDDRWVEVMRVLLEMCALNALFGRCWAWQREALIGNSLFLQAINTFWRSAFNRDFRLSQLSFCPFCGAVQDMWNFSNNG